MLLLCYFVFVSYPAATTLRHVKSAQHSQKGGDPVRLTITFPRNLFTNLVHARGVCVYLNSSVIGTAIFVYVLKWRDNEELCPFEHSIFF